MKALTAGLGNPELAELIDNQLCDTSYPESPVLETVKPGGTNSFCRSCNTLSVSLQCASQEAERSSSGLVQL